MDIFLLITVFLSIIVFSSGAVGNNGMFTECCIHNNNYYYTYRMQIIVIILYIYNYNNYACYYISIGVYGPEHGLYIIIIIIIVHP